jgi:hypothetical protein
MEVHHHAHIPTSREKKWTHYFWEFLMLFLAVFCGFLAEYQLEHQIEKDRERQFIFSMVREIKADTAQLHIRMRDTVRKYALDTLVRILYSSTARLKDTRKAYYLYRQNVGLVSAMNFSNNTLTQLKSGGNMRLIRNQNVVDSLNMLDNWIHTIGRQFEEYQQAKTRTLTSGARIFNENYYRKEGSFAGQDYVLSRPDPPVYMTGDTSQIIELANLLSMQTVIFIRYHLQLNNYDKLAKRLIPYLKKEYHMK